METAEDRWEQLVQSLTSRPALARLLESEPECFRFVAAEDRQPASGDALRVRFAEQLRQGTSVCQAENAIDRCVTGEMLKIVYAEFIDGLPPDRVARYLSELTDAVLAAALDFTLGHTTSHLGMPQRIDGSTPEYSIIALGEYGGEEIGHRSPLDLLLLCDQIDRKNESHLRFNHQVAAGLLRLLASCRGPFGPIDLRLQHPGERPSALASLDFHDAADAANRMEHENQTFLRISLVKARVAAGDSRLGNMFLGRIRPWLTHRLPSRWEIADLHVLRKKLLRRSATDQSGDEETDPNTSIAGHSDSDALQLWPGARCDIELTIEFLQFLHSAELPEVRTRGTIDAIASLHQCDYLTQDEATTFAENHARLCRLEHYLCVLLDQRIAHLPEDEILGARLAWWLGVRVAASGDDPQAKSGSVGDFARFEKLLSETLDVNRKTIEHLIAQTIDASQFDDSETAMEMETELLLDPEPDLNTYREVMKRHGLIDSDLAISRLFRLAHNNPSFCSQHRCRHSFAVLLPRLLRSIASTPAPDRTLASFVELSDSIGAKATWWELLSTHHATFSLVLRLCSLAPYLTGVLIENPGMVDELVDSLARDRLPRAERLDMTSIRLCQSVEDPTPVLKTFHASCHLMIGIRDLLKQETVNAVGQSLSDCAEAILRRTIQKEQDRLAARYGDPVDEQGDAVEMVTVALGSFGVSERSYHSGLELTFLYTSDGETRRRVGGPRTTLSNHEFFIQLAENVTQQLAMIMGQTNDLTPTFPSGADEAPRAQSMESFLEPFRQDTAPLGQRAALCQARPCSGSRTAIELARVSIAQAIMQSTWRESDCGELRKLRQRAESSSAAGHLQRGVGGTDDVKYLVAAGILRYSLFERMGNATGVLAALSELADAGVYESADTEVLAENYRYLRNVETKWALIGGSADHELALHAGDGILNTLARKQLAALLGESGPEETVRHCETIRSQNRELFDRLLTP